MLTPITLNLASIGCIARLVTAPKEFHYNWHMISPPKIVKKGKLQSKQL